MISLQQLIEKLVSQELRHLNEDLGRRKAFVKDLVKMGLQHGDEVSPLEKNRIEKLISIGRPLKQLFSKHADHQWLNTLTTVHYVHNGSSLQKFFQSVSSKDELSAMAYLPNRLWPSIWGSIGVVIKGRITLLANDMDDVYSGSGEAYTDALPDRTKHSGANKGVYARYVADAYIEESIFVFDEKDWDRRGSGNEALVDNWKPIAIIMRPQRSLYSYEKDPSIEELKQPIQNILSDLNLDIPVFTETEALKVF